MNRSLFLLGIPLIITALIAGGLVSAGLYRWEQTVRITAPAAVTPQVAQVSPTPSASTPSGTPERAAQTLPTGTPEGATLTRIAESGAAAGQAVYAQLCDPCHPGGGTGLGPALSGPAFEDKYGDDAPLAALTRQGRAGMPGFPEARISDKQLEDLIAFVRRLGAAGSEATPTEVAVAGQLTWTGSFARDIQPIFDEYCVRCHGEALAENGLRLDSYEGVMKGTRGGPVVSPGVASGSTLVWVIQGLAAPELRMPHAERPLSPNRIQNIVLWIDADAPGD